MHGNQNQQHGIFIWSQHSSYYKMSDHQEDNRAIISKFRRQ